MTRYDPGNHEDAEDYVTDGAEFEVFETFCQLITVSELPYKVEW